MKKTFDCKASEPLLKYISLAQTQQQRQGARMYSGLPQHHLHEEKHLGPRVRQQFLSQI